jgi:EAL domain-containing protein (putative c-di-GMP-specific phosphodiesterase class I)/CheY-like chemotaxis protein
VPDRPLILIADDDAATRDLLDAALRREGFETCQASNGRDALEILRQQPVELVLLDMNMPILDGLETLGAIRRADELRSLPVIMVTASAEEADRVRGLESGADDYLAKPIVMRELMARVRAHLRERQALASDLERARTNRRKLAAAIEGLATGSSLPAIAAAVASRLPELLALDGAAILYFGGEGVRSIAASGKLQSRFPAASTLPSADGGEIAERAESGPWIEVAGPGPGGPARSIDVAFVPFRLGPTVEPLGCLAYALRPGRAGPLSYRLRELIDATDYIVVALRPAIEQAEAAEGAISRLRRVIDARAFKIHLQRIVRLETGETVAVEALSRFDDETPAQVQFAEAAAYGLGATLQRAAVAAAIEVAAPLPGGIALSVNLSADVIQHEKTLPDLLRSVERPMIVEITEHERIDDYAVVRSALERLGPNVRLAIDDAGSGYASLRHIFALQPAFVKLDIEWVRGIDRDPVRRALVSGLVYFANETDCELIAEGIETPEELDAVRALGIHLGQGHLLGSPAARL